MTLALLCAFSLLLAFMIGLLFGLKTLAMASKLGLLHGEGLTVTIDGKRYRVTEENEK